MPRKAAPAEKVSKPSTRAQTLYNLAEKSAYHAFKALHGPLKGGQKAFRNLLLEHNWAVPHRYRKTPISPSRREAERRFIEEGLGRQGRYTPHRYPDSGAGESEVT